MWTRLKLPAVLLVAAAALMPLGSGVRSQRPAGREPATILVGERDLYPEGIACDPTSGVLYVSSLTKAKIVAVSPDGSARDFFPPGRGGYGRGLGMKVDARRGELWALSCHGPVTARRSRVSVFDLRTGRLKREYRQPDEENRLFNDLDIGPDGSVFLTDTFGHAVFRIGPGSSGLSLLARSEAELPDPNGIAVSADGAVLFAASGALGLVRSDAASGRIARLPNATGIPSAGIDGLVRVGTSLYAVINDAPQPAPTRVARFDLDKAGTTIVGAEVLDEDHPLFDIPTTCAAVGRWRYVLAPSHLHLLEADKPRPGAAPGDIVVLRYPLARKPAPGASAVQP